MASTGASAAHSLDGLPSPMSVLFVSELSPGLGFGCSLTATHRNVKAVQALKLHKTSP